MPIGALQRGEDWAAIARELCDCVRAKKDSLPEGWSELRCATPSGRELVLQTRRVKAPGANVYLTLIRRYGPFDVEGTVRTALKKKLPKLVATNVERRLLMFERDQWHLDHTTIAAAVEALRPYFPGLASIDEIWIAETHDDRQIVLFDPLLPGRGYAPVYTFNGDTPHRSPAY